MSCLLINFIWTYILENPTMPICPLYLMWCVNTTSLYVSGRTYSEFSKLGAFIYVTIKATRNHQRTGNPTDAFHPEHWTLCTPTVFHLAPRTRSRCKNRTNNRITDHETKVRHACLEGILEPNNLSFYLCNYELILIDTQEQHTMKHSLIWTDKPIRKLRKETDQAH